jgi:hypothetical protein
MPDWREIELEWEELGVLSPRWKSKLTEWRGIYYIFDTSDGKGYVGSAYGVDNLLGRWLHYAASGHGGNSLVRNPTACVARRGYRQPDTVGKYLEEAAPHAKAIRPQR